MKLDFKIVSLLKLLKSQLSAILFEAPQDKNYILKFRRSRLIMFACFLAIHMATVSLLDPLLTEAEAPVFEGNLSKIHILPRYFGIQLSTDYGEMEIKTLHGAGFLENLQPFLGVEAKVWAYRKLNNFYVPENILVQIEVNDEKFIEDWETSAEYFRKPRELILIAIAIIVLIFNINSILKIQKGIRDATDKTPK